MKLKFTRFSARFVMSCFVIGSMFHTGAYTVEAETNTRVHVYYEETGGNIGTYDSINEALKKADGKQKIVLELLDSEYQEFVTIDKANVTLKSKDSSNPATLKGVTIKDEAKNDTMIRIEAPNVTVDSVNITGLWLDEPGEDTNPVGIRIEADYATIKNCEIYDMGCSYTEGTVEGTGFNGHGIICSNEDNSSEDVAIKNPVVTNCKLHDLKLGNSETLVMNGNVSGFEITNNIIYRCDNIGIDIIGYEKSHYSDYDRARSGVVKNNIVYDVTSGDNPTYREDVSEKPGACAGGIYVDGGYDVTIEGNYVENCDIGVELACEHGGQTTDSIRLYNNILINNNELGGISIGGSGSKNGNATNLEIKNNTVYNTEEACFRVQKADCEDNVISNNIFIAEGNAKIYSKQSNAGVNDIGNNYITKKSSVYSDVGDKQFNAENIKYDKKTGTITFDYDQSKYDLTGYGATPLYNPYAKPQGIAVTYYDGIYSRGFAWSTDDTISSSSLYIIKKTSGMQTTDLTTETKLFENQIITDEKTKAKYKITKLVEENGEVVGGNVTYVKALDKKCKKATIKAKVTLNGVTFKITAIDKNAFKNCKKLKNVTIGENVTTIGKKAFFGCKKLKTINIKSLKIKKIGKKSFGNIDANANFKLAKKKRAKIQILVDKSK